ncbi:MAG: Hsp20/alpha crystallin family protein [Sphingobacteriia bacterium]|nr:MAG: Hsp20/alpha crystallin family protein [Sphingobacteriia bacterium]TAG30105.1 MAG: Hsp20/alpha crystallin family protein [Sphingobacteriia bacterium]TAH07334.1 MAG: Hsp20/alpha crystallin family protein [Sphingobacteriia bacterium]
MTQLKNNPISLLDELFNGFPASWGRDSQQGYPTASVNIHETDDAYHLELNAPGRNKEDFMLNVDKGILTISYERKELPEEKNYKTVRREFTYKSFKRSFTVDDKINTEGIQARYENGVLKILLPKKEQLKSAPTQITIV